MNNKNIVIIVVVVVAAGAVVLLKQGKKAVPPADSAAHAGVEASAPQGKAMPRLVDIGAGKCNPCKMMKPILDDLKVTYADIFKTEFIDVWENPESGKQYKIKIIPTQIFYGADGKELFRHEGFFSKEGILAKWKDLGVAQTK